MHKHKGRTRFVLLCVLPATILFTIFMVVPTLQVFWMSMFKWGGYSDEKTFVGLGNFRTLMEDGKFLRSFQNTVLLIVVVTLVTFALALVFAGILTREKLRGQNFFRVVFYIPNILSVVVIAALSTVHSCYKTVQNQSVQCSHDGFHFWVIGYEKVAWTLRV